jgi:hypothetical protein
MKVTGEDKIDDTSFVIFSAVPDQERLIPANRNNTPQYFM